MVGFARARVVKIIRDAGVQRVSDDAVNRLNEVLISYQFRIAKHTVEIARHSGRKTIKESDTKLAASKVL